MCVDCELSSLAKKVKKWFEDGRKKDFDYRFTGRETKKLCLKYMFLLDSVSSDGDGPNTKLKIVSLAYIGLHLRDAVSRFAHVETDQNQVTQLKKNCHNFFNATSLFLSVSPTV